MAKDDTKAAAPQPLSPADEARLRRLEDYLAAEQQAAPGAGPQLVTLTESLEERFRRIEQRLEDRDRERLKFETFKSWAALSAQEKSQLKADEAYRADLGRLPLWEVQLVQVKEEGQAAREIGWPLLKIPGNSREEAVARYSQLCGINGLAADQGLQYRAARVAQAA